MSFSSRRYRKLFKRLAPTSGFSLVEIMVTLAVSAIVLTAIFQVYISNTRSFSVQHEVVEMEQNLRAGMRFMATELKKARYNPTSIDGTGGANAQLPTIRTATSTSIYFIKDDNGNGFTNDTGDHEMIRFFDGDKIGFSHGTIDTDANTDGIPDFAATPNVLAENIEGVELFYRENGVYTLTPSDLTAITAVQVTVVARTSVEDTKFSNTDTYTGPGGTVFYDGSSSPDGFRRRLLTTTVKFRNLDL